MTVPVRCPQKPSIWSEDIAMTCGCLNVLPLEVINPVKLPLGSEIIADPNPVIAEALNRSKHLVSEGSQRSIPLEEVGSARTHPAIGFY